MSIDQKLSEVMDLYNDESDPMEYLKKKFPDLKEEEITQEALGFMMALGRSREIDGEIIVAMAKLFTCDCGKDGCPGYRYSRIVPLHLEGLVPLPEWYLEKHSIFHIPGEKGN